MFTSLHALRRLMCGIATPCFFLVPLLFASLHTDAHATAETPGAGHLVIIGGALRVDNAEVWQRIVDLAGGAGHCIAVIPAASAQPERAGAATAATLTRYGAQTFVLPLSERDREHDVVQTAHDPQWLARLSACHGVYFTGGDQGRIVHALRHADGTPTPLLDAIWRLYRNGGVIAGSSAGAAIMSEVMFHDARPVLPTLKQGLRVDRDIAAGLGFIGPGIFVDQHLIIRGRFARMLPVMLERHIPIGLGIDENTAMVVSPKREIDIIGYKGALLLDLRQATHDPHGSAFNVQGVRISYLDRGDRYLLEEGKLIVSADKQQHHLSIHSEAARDMGLCTDILGNTAVVDLLFRLIESPARSARGLAFDESPPATLGFEFRLQKTAETQGYYSNASGAESFTVHQVQMDVRPVQIGAPFYRD